LKKRAAVPVPLTHPEVAEVLPAKVLTVPKPPAGTAPPVLPGVVEKALPIGSTLVEGLYDILGACAAALCDNNNTHAIQTEKHKTRFFIKIPGRRQPAHNRTSPLNFDVIIFLIFFYFAIRPSGLGNYCGNQCHICQYQESVNG